MKDQIIGIVLATIFGFCVSGLMFLKPSPPYKVVEAVRIYDCTYQVGFEDRHGYYFSLTQDLVKFSAMGVNVDDILIYGEQ